MLDTKDSSSMCTASRSRISLRDVVVAPLLILCAVALILSPETAQATANPALCRQTVNETITGTCFPYPPVGASCSNVIGGKMVYLGFNRTVPEQEVFVLTFMAILRQNRGIVDDRCLRVGDAFACNAIYPSCQPTDPVNPFFSEGIPSLLCDSFCQELWSACGIPFNQFNLGNIFGTKTFDVKEFSFPHCPNGEFGVGTFEQGPQSRDFFGERFIRTLGPFPSGYTGQPRTPESIAQFRLLNGTALNVQCKVPDIPAEPADISVFLPQDGPVCSFPLVSDGEKCVIPCPFPVIPEGDQDRIGQAFVVPAIFGFVFCVFVLFDSLFVIAESQGFNRLFKLRKRLMNTTTGTDDGSTGMGTSASGSKRRKSQLRAATLYSLLGAILCIIFFFIGPVMTLVRGNKISCGVEPLTIDLGDVARGTADLSDSSCRAQRAAPFLLQMIFNLILYAIVRVYLVVTERSRSWDERRKKFFDILLISYCAGIPILFLIVAMVKDRLSDVVVDFITQFSRNSAICVPRLSVADEVVLIFMPFIITGVAITWLSFNIYTHLNAISKGVTGVTNHDPKKNSSAVALKLLMTRLSALGVATFLVLLIFISASASLMQAMAVFAPKFNAFFGCEAVKASTCKDCIGEKALMLDALPSSVAFAAQIAAMSSITLLFGGFFAAQSSARLYREFQDGTLQIKIGNLIHGRPIAIKKNLMESSLNSFSHQINDKFQETKEAVKESCLSIWYGRYNEWRQSLHGRARGRVFRWQRNPATGTNNGKRGGKPEKRKFDFVPRSWNSKKDNKVGDGQWHGVVGGINHSEDSSAMTSSSAMWKTSMSQTRGAGGYTESWVGPNNPVVGAWNAGFAPSEPAAYDAGDRRSFGNDEDDADYDTGGNASSSNAVGLAPKVIVIDDDHTHRTPSRPPSRCPSI